MGEGAFFFYYRWTLPILIRLRRPFKRRLGEGMWMDGHLMKLIRQTHVAEHDSSEDKVARLRRGLLLIAPAELHLHMNMEVSCMLMVERNIFTQPDIRRHSRIANTCPLA